MRGYELIKAIMNGEIADKTELKVKKGDCTVTKIKVVGGVIKWDMGTFNTGYLTDPAIEFEVTEKPKGWFKPEYGELYSYISDYGDIDTVHWGDDCEDEYRYTIHNCFRNIEEASEYLNYKKTLRKAEKPFEYMKWNYFVAYSLASKRVYAGLRNTFKSQGTIYLGQDEKVVKKFIEKWEPQILKFEFGIWE